ncbi:MULTISPECIES: hypothetical protein [unclassified Rickettsia]
MSYRGLTTVSSLYFIFFWMPWSSHGMTRTRLPRRDYVPPRNDG